MNRAEKRRQKKLAKKAASNAKLGKATIPSPGQQTPTTQQSLELAVRHHKAGDLAKAEGLYQQILQADPNQPVALHLLGVSAHQVGKNDIAVDLIAKALAIKPDLAEAHSNLGLALQKLGKLDEAVASYNKAIALNPDFARAHYNLGNALKELNKLDGAAASYEQALAIKPDYVEAHNNLGNTLQELGNLDEAVASHQKTLALKPDYAEAHYNLGNAFKELGKLDEAVESYHKALAFKLDFTEAHNNLGNALQALGKLDEAVVSFHKALAIKPDLAEVHCNLGKAFQELGRLDEAVASCHKALAIKPDYAEAHSKLIFTQNYLAAHSTIELLDEARRYGENVTANAQPISNHSNYPDRDRQLRVGLVSGDFRQHPVGYFLQGFLSEINMNKIEIYAYSTCTTEDDLTAKIKANVSKWRKVMGVSDEQLAIDMVDDGIDILVDLSGHTGYNRLPLFAWKPAPVQVTWIGSNITTGVRAIDYILCDQWTLPHEEESHFVEKPWRLPNTWLCFTPPELDIEVGPLPALESGSITFGCFNNLTKINDAVVKCWSDVLKTIPDSKLFLKTRQISSNSFREKTLMNFKNNGIAMSRVVLEAHSQRAELLESYQKIDIALDPFPFPGGISSMEALWMGVPVLSVQGARFVSHVAESTLHNVGLSDWIASSPEDVVTKAETLTSDLTVLAELRQNLRQRLIDSPLCDNRTFAQNLNDALREMWINWCEKTSK